MERTTRNTLLVAVALGLAILFGRLGFWQLDRHGEASDRAQDRRTRFHDAPLELGAGPFPPPEELHWRRVTLRGRLAHHESVVLRGRGFQGTPGVHLVTPLVRTGGPDVLVVRGWLPAADGIHAPLSRAGSAGDSGPVTVRGLVLPGADSTGDIRRTPVDGKPRLVTSRLAPEVLSDSLDRPLAPFYVRQLTDRSFRDPAAPKHVGWGGRPPSAGDDSLPVRLAAPEIDSGPHLSYAIQWFAFAAIVLVGSAAYLFTRGREE